MVEGNRAVEEQAKWEARYLTGLLGAGLKAEEPQAIVLYKDGRRAVITKGISHSTRTLAEVKFAGPPYDLMIEGAKKLGALPQDEGAHNVILDDAGHDNIIDVNRWTWRQPQEGKEDANKKGLPLYDSTKYMRRLIAELDRLRNLPKD